MKKIIAAVALLLGASSVFAANDTLLEGTKATDNWRIGVAGGIAFPLNFSKGNDESLKPKARFGLDVRKDLTPIFAIGLEGRVGMGTEKYICGFESNNKIGDLYVGAFTTINLNNLFAGYAGHPRVFEVETQVGTGWAHYFFPQTQCPDMNSFATKLGLNFNFNLGKAVVLGIRPYVMYDLCASRSDVTTAQFDIRRATFNVELGLAYKFKGSNGAHYFTQTKAYDQAEVDALNGKINALRGDLDGKNGVLNDANDEIAKLNAALAACLAKPATVIEKNTVKKANALESVVTFAKGASTVAASQLPNVERIATYLKNHKDSKVVIRGFASPEGNPEVNARLANARAEAVKTILVNKYKIATSRIDSEGQGVGDMFSEPDWNRVSICTINETEK